MFFVSWMNIQMSKNLSLFLSWNGCSHSVCKFVPIVTDKPAGVPKVTILSICKWIIIFLQSLLGILSQETKI